MSKVVKVEKLEVVKPTGKVPTLSSGGDMAAAKHLGKLFTDANTGMRRIIAAGIFAWELKDKLNHGEFGPWLAAHCPQLATVHSETGRPQPSRALSGYMELTKGVMESIGFKTVEKFIGEISSVAAEAKLSGGRFLLCPEKKVPAALKEARENIFALVDGKSQRALFLEFKQAEDGADGLKKKKGRLKGQGGASAKQRADAAEQERLERLEGNEAWVLSFEAEANERADDTHLGDPKFPDDMKARALAAAELLVNFLRPRVQCKKV